MAIVKRTIEGMYELLTYTSAFKPHVYLAYLKKKKKSDPSSIEVAASWQLFRGSVKEALSQLARVLPASFRLSALFIYWN